MRSNATDDQPARARTIIDDVYHHGLRVAALASTMCRELGFEPAYAEALQQAAVLHDVGKLAMPVQLWSKPRALDVQERRLAQEHTVRGDALLRQLGQPLAALVADSTLYHHEAWDGSGYPHGLAGEAIPFAARLIGLCDVYSALREVRPYKQAFVHDRAMAMLQQAEATARVHRGMFDPALLGTFIRIAQPIQAAFDRADAREALNQLPGLRATLQAAADAARQEGRASVRPPPRQ